MSAEPSPLAKDVSTEVFPNSDKLWKKGFWSLFAVQFQGALSDNIFKFLVLFIVKDAVDSINERNQLIALSAAIFSLPFLLFSMAAGCLADRYPKRNLIVGAKWMEIGVMAVGTIGLVTGNLLVLWAVIFLMSTQSTFFSPAKYGSMPEILPEDRLSWGNGILSFGTFVAIITGGIVAGVLYKSLAGFPLVWGGALVVLALVGLALSYLVPKIAAAAPDKRFRWNFLTDLGILSGWR